MFININDIKNGMTIIMDGNLCTIQEFQHVKPGKGPAFVRIKLKNLRTGSTVEDTYNTNLKIQKAHIDRTEVSFLYAAGDNYTFMNNETYEQIEVPTKVLGDNVKFIKEGLTLTLDIYEGEIIGVTLPEKVEYEVIEKGSTGFLGIGSKNAVIKARKKYSLEGSVREFLGSVFAAMKMEVEVLIKIDEVEHTIDIELKGDDMGILIGKRGQTLDSLQYLTSLAVNKQSEEYYKVKIDTEDYRKRRKDTLENLAKNIAYKVKRTKRPVSLEPMNPFERRIIHSALQNDRYVTTHSEGDEPYRHVVVTLKR